MRFSHSDNRIGIGVRSNVQLSAQLAIDLNNQSDG